MAKVVFFLQSAKIEVMKIFRNDDFARATLPMTGIEVDGVPQPDSVISLSMGAGDDFLTAEFKVQTSFAGPMNHNVIAEAANRLMRRLIQTHPSAGRSVKDVVLFSCELGLPTPQRHEYDALAPQGGW